MSALPLPLPERGALLTSLVRVPGVSRAQFDQGLERLALRESQLPKALTEAERRPVVTLGAGSIVRDAHAPAYALLGVERLGVFDPNEAARGGALTLGYQWAVDSLDEAVRRGSERGAVFDLALPPSAILPTLLALPDGASVLIQKPLGKSLAEAERIAVVCDRKRLVVGVNFQLPFSPQIVAAVGAVRLGLVGRLRSARVELELVTTWALWEFLLHEPRIEVLLHSIHYLSLFVQLFGNPSALRSRQWGDPSHPVFKERDICSETELEYAVEAPASGTPRPFTCSIRANHVSTKPRQEWKSELVLEGERGTVTATIADNLDYPNGVDDALYVQHESFGSHAVPLVGNRFPLAFVATMAHLQRATSRGCAPPNDLGLGLATMRLAERCYDSNALGAGRIPLDAP